MTMLTDTLALGGGVVYMQESFTSGTYEDLGYVEDFEFGANIVQEYFSKYYTDSRGRLIRLPTTNGVIKSVVFEGSFVCESMSRSILQKVWLLGTSSNSGTEPLAVDELKPVVRALKFVPNMEVGPAMCIELPAVQLTATTKYKLISGTWKSLTFNFSSVFDMTIRTFPIVRVQESGESLEDFCV